MAAAEQLGQRLADAIGTVIVGQAEAVRLLAVALLSGGHMLLEGPPGTAKTLLAQCFARAIGLDFGRIQFTPDLMPGDIIGSNLFNFQTSQFTLSQGPVFTELLLADEINRAPPKTQAALLEAMQERQVTIDGQSLKLSDRFMVVATENPIENQGVYPLPEAQLDRFLFKHVVGYPDAAAERAIVAGHGDRAGAVLAINPVTDAAGIAAAMAETAAVRLADDVADYVVALIRATRVTPDLALGASPRAAVMLGVAARAQAALEGRDYTIPDDVKLLAAPLLRHRVVLSAAAAIEGKPVDAVVRRLIDEVAAPR